MRPAPGRHADDDLGGRRLPPSGARRARVAASADARGRGPPVRCQPGGRLDRCGSHDGLRSGPRTPRRRGGARSVLGRALRGVARQACHPRRRARMREPLLHQRFVGPWRDARTGTGAVACRAHVLRARGDSGPDAARAVAVRAR